MGEIRNDLESIMIAVNFLDNAPFKWVGLILRYGLKNDDGPSYQRINHKHGDLPVAIELDTHELRNASRDELKELFMIATLKTLVHIGKKYHLPYERFEELLEYWQSLRAVRSVEEP
jgi:hypothetical protein